MLYGHGTSGEMEVSLDSECFVRVIVAVLSPASLLRNSGGRPSLTMVILVLRLQTEGTTHVCYT